MDLCFQRSFPLLTIRGKKCRFLVFLLWHHFSDPKLILYGQKGWAISTLNLQELLSHEAHRFCADINAGGDLELYSYHKDRVHG